MLNKLITAFLAISLVAAPAVTSAALKITATAAIDSSSMAAMHADFPGNAAAGSFDITAVEGVNRAPEGFVTTTAGNEKCHQVEDSGCCKDECGCCLAQLFPMSSNVIGTISFSQPKNILESVGLLDADLDRLIRPPRYI